MARTKLQKLQWMLRLLGWFKIPLIAFLRPKIVFFSDEEVKLKIRLRRRTKNHLQSMYFGALAVGADVAAGLHVFSFCSDQQLKFSFAFKGMNAQFLKRAESDVTFYCHAGEQIKALVLEAKNTGERINKEVQILAYDQNQELIAIFDMMISLKVYTAK